MFIHFRLGAEPGHGLIYRHSQHFRLRVDEILYCTEVGCTVVVCQGLLKKRLGGEAVQAGMLGFRNSFKPADRIPQGMNAFSKRIG